MEKNHLPGIIFEGRAASWQDVLNMWGHCRSLVLPQTVWPHICFKMLLQKYDISPLSLIFQRLQCQRFRGKMWVPLIINPTYTLYSGYHPKGPPPFFPVNSGDWCDFHCALGWRFSGQMCWTYSFSWCTFTVPGTSSFGRGRCQLGGGFKYFSFSPLLGEDFQFD